MFASSAAIYGDVADMPVSEDAPCRPVSPYGIHKLASEHALDYYATTHGVRAAALRFFNVYGPRQDPTSPYSGVISIFTDRARAGKPLVIFGDGTQTRDFVYVGDVVRAIAAALHGDRSIVANVGTGSEITVVELARSIVELCGGRSAIEHAPARAGEILRSRARVDRLRELLGVAAKRGSRRRAPLDVGVRSATISEAEASAMSDSVNAWVVRSGFTLVHAPASSAQHARTILEP